MADPPRPGGSATGPDDLKDDAALTPEEEAARHNVNLMQALSLLRSFDRNSVTYNYENLFKDSLYEIEHGLTFRLNNFIQASRSRPSVSEPKVKKEELLDQLQTHADCLEHAASARRSMASVEAEAFFTAIDKQRPVELKAKKTKGKKGKLEREGLLNFAVDDKPAPRSMLREKPSTSTSKPLPAPVQQEEEALDVTISAPSTPKLKRRAVNTVEKKAKKKKEELRREKETPKTPPVITVRDEVERLMAQEAAAAASSSTSNGNGKIGKRTSNRLSKTPRVKTKEEDEPTYCFCNRISFGEMIGCDNDKCEIEWYHFECIGLKTKPKGKWFCPDCRHLDNAKVPKTSKAATAREKAAAAAAAATEP